MKKVLFTDPAAVIAAFEKATQSGAKTLVVLSGSVGPTGKSWCPDCDVARPAITKMLEAWSSNPDNTDCIYGEIVERNSWVGVPDHPLKKHPLIKAAGVPSVALYEGTTELHRVDDLANFANEDLMEMFTA